MHNVFNLTGFRFALFKEKGQKGELVSSRSKTLLSYGLKNGDMIYMTPINGAILQTEEPGSSTSNAADKYNLPGTSGNYPLIFCL